MDIIEVWAKAKYLISMGFPLEGVSEQILKLPRENIEACYENWNLLHWAISSDRADVVEFLFKKGYFVLPHRNSTVPYLHMAAACGTKEVVDILLKYRAEDLEIKVSRDDTYWKDFLANLRKGLGV